MAVVIASALGKDVAGAPLFRGVSFKLERGDRMTLAGRNGAGKTTLLRMLAGASSVDEGELVLEKGARITLHDQRPPRERGLTLRDYVLAGCADLVALEQRLRDLEAEMAAAPEDSGILGRYAKAQSRLEHAGGWNWRAKAIAPLHGLGFVDDQLDRELRTFSGGELTRASLARALAGDPDLLLLDEPTNHLDISSLEWLEGYLTALDAAVILVAHDRWFLEAVGTSVLELEAGRARFFPGPWHAWRRELAAREIALGKAIDKQQREIARMERFVERFRYKASKARQAQSRVKQLAKIERIDRDPRDTRSLGFSFGSAERTGRVVLELDDARLEVPGRTLLEDGELWLERGEHVSLVGPNGVGKTTLIEALTGRRPLDGGRLKTGHNVNFGYLSQHTQELGSTGTALAAAQRATGLTPGKARALLGQFLFSGEEAEKPLEGLSGGERRRLSLAVLVASGANVLILDEPTNHLDLDAREALEDALLAFDGALILVSHDRALLDAVGSRTVAFEDGALRSYEGGWAEYARVRDERREAAIPPKPKRREPAKPAREARSGPSKNAVRRAGELEREVERAEASLAAIEDELADPAMWSSPTRRERATKRHADAKRALEEAYTAWEDASRGLAPGPPLDAAGVRLGRRRGRGGAAPAGDGWRLLVEQGRVSPRDAVREALVGQRLVRGRLDRVDPAQLAAEVALGGLHEAVAVVVELGVDRPWVGRLEQVDDRLGRVRVVRVGAGQDAAATLPQARRRDRAAHELGRDRLLVVLVDAHVTGHERVDVAGDEHHVLDLLAAQVLQQLVALARIALPGVEADVVAAGVDRRHDHHLVGDHLPRRLRAGQSLLGEVHLAPAEEVARGVEIGAGRPHLGVAAGLVGPVLALVEQQQVDGLPEAHAAVDPVVARALGAVGGHAVEERAVGGGLARR